MTARSYLFVPGDRPERFEKALASGADRIVIDLEDAVAPADKDKARHNIRAWLEARGKDVAVCLRINGVGQPGHADDAALGQLAGVAALMVPKSEKAEALAALHARLPATTGLIALIESVAGVMNVRDIARAPGVQRLGFGSIDFCVDSGMRDERGALDPVRVQLVLESRYAGLAAPIAGISMAIDDPATLTNDVAQARAFGFGAKLCIHPKQVSLVNAGFLPGEQERAWAKRVLAAVEDDPRGAITVDGKLIDKPLVDLAQAILAAGN